MDPATAGTVGFLIRLVFLVAVVILALRIAGLNPRTLAISGAIAAVVFGLAAQQTLGNLIAGLVLISVRPFKVGDRVRLQSGSLAGEVEGVVTTLGLLYTTFARGDDSIMVPNNIVLGSAVVPLREPASVELRARLRPDVLPSEVQTLLRNGVRKPVRAEPHIGLEEADADEVVVRIAATPVAEADGPQLADEILAAITPVMREGHTEERQVARRSDDDGGRQHDGALARDEHRDGASWAAGFEHHLLSAFRCFSMRSIVRSSSRTSSRVSFPASKSCAIIGSAWPPKKLRISSSSRWRA